MTILADTITLARWKARKAVRARQGIRWVYVEPAALTKAANAYLAEHRDELLAKAWEQLSVRIQTKERTLPIGSERQHKGNQR
jgi:hypothetical protein